jgi:hypothetical protein
MKNDQAINLRVDEAMFRSIGRLAAEIDCTQAELIRTCVRLSLAQIKEHPSLIELSQMKMRYARNDV